MRFGGALANVQAGNKVEQQDVTVAKDERFMKSLRSINFPSSLCQGTHKFRENPIITFDAVNAGEVKESRLRHRLKSSPWNHRT
jgi:hypothetical protein